MQEDNWDKHWIRIIEDAEVGVYRTRRNGSQIVQANKKFCEICGIPQEQITQHTSIELWQRPEDRMQLLRDLPTDDSALRDVRFPLVTQDGQKKDCLLSVRASPCGEFLEGTLVDISQLAQTERDLIESERTIRTLMSNLPGMVYRCTMDQWAMVFVSEGCLALTGYTSIELTDPALPYEQLIVPEDREMVTQAVSQGVKENRPFTMEYRIKTKNGRIRHVWEQGRAVSSEPTRPPLLEGFVLDITERVESNLERTRALQFITAMDRINSALLNSIQIEDGINAALEVTRELLDCDRVWLTSPCRTGQTTLPVSFLRTHPNGAYHLDLEQLAVPFDHTQEFFFDKVLSQNKPVTGGPGNDVNSSLDEDTWATYHIRSVMAVAMDQVSDDPWVLGAHHCREDRTWTEGERWLFSEIAARLSHAVSTYLLRSEIDRSKDALQERVEERTHELQPLVKAMSGRELRMAELKESIRILYKQVQDLGGTPKAGVHRGLDYETDSEF